MAYLTDSAPSGLTALTSLATDDTIVVGDTSDTSEVVKTITKANLITDLTTSFAAALGADDNYVTDAEKIVIGNTSGTNTGDNAVNSNYSSLVTNATHTGDATGSGALTVVALNGTNLAALGTGVLKNTTTTGVPFISKVTLTEPATSATITATDGTTTTLSGGTHSGTNTGDQTTIVGITGTKAQFDTAVTDGNFLYVGDVTTNATHTGEVTGSGALTVDKTAITNKTLVTAAVGDHVLIADASDTDNLKKVTVQTIVDLASGGSTDISCRVYQSAGTSLTTTLSAIPFNSESFDTDTMHDTATNNTRITFTTAGKYVVGGIVNTDANAASWAGIRLNGTTYIATNGAGNAGASTGNGTNMETPYVFSASDYVELMGAFGTTQNTKAGISGTSFYAYKIG